MLRTRALVKGSWWAVPVLLAAVVAVPAGSASADDAGVMGPAVDLVDVADGCTGHGCTEPISRREMAGWVVEVFIDAGRAELVAHSGRFEDVQDTDPWAAHIETLAALGITDGCSREPVKYCPDRSVTRGEMAVFLVRTFDLPDPVGEPRSFIDVADDHWFAYAIRSLAAAEVTVGYADGTYRPDTEVSRWHMSLFLKRAAAYSWGTWRVLSTGRADEGCTVTFAHSRTGDSRIAAVPCTALDEGDVFSVIGFDRRLEAWAAAAACDHLRRGLHADTYPAPSRIEVTAITIAFDDLPAPGERYIAELHAAPEERFIDEVLAAVEVQLEALSHGRTDWVFRRGGEVTLPGSAHSRAGPASLGRQILSRAASEVSALFPDVNLLAFHTATREFPYTSFYGSGVPVVAVETEDDPNEWVFHRDDGTIVDFRSADPAIDAYRWSGTRFEWALSAAAHELLHLVGLQDTYATMRDDGRGPPDTDSGQDSMMGLSSYGWGRGFLGSSEPIEYISRDGRVVHGSLPDARRPNEPLTGWNKWVLGWLDGSEAVCVRPPSETTTVVLRPHQLTSIGTFVQWEDDPARCWRRDGGGYWGGAASDPVIAIVPTSAHTAVVIEADPFAAQGVADVPQCGPSELPYSLNQCSAPNDYDSQGGEYATISTRPVGDIIIYDVDLRAHSRPLLLVAPTVAVVSPDKFERLAPLYGPTGAFGKHYVPGGQFANDAVGRGVWPDGLPVECYYMTEMTVHGYRIAVASSTVTDDGQPEVTVTIEPLLPA